MSFEGKIGSLLKVFSLFLDPRQIIYFQDEIVISRLEWDYAFLIRQRLSVFLVTFF